MQQDDTNEGAENPVIIAIDFDSFYCACHMKQDPSLRGVPFAVRQKQIVVTCSYAARERGVYKLQLMTEAKKVCPQLVVVNGEDLTIYRNASKANFLYVRDIVWGQKVEKLGFDELWLDVTEMIDHNMKFNGIFDLGFGKSFTYNEMPGYTFPLDKEVDKRLQIAMHLAKHFRDSIADELGFTSSAGVSTNKLLSKLVSSVHKPDKQTLLVPGFEKLFLSDMEIGKLPGLGYKSSALIRERLRGSANKSDRYEAADNMVTIRDVCTGYSEEEFVSIFGETLGKRLWDLAHGVDESEVVPAPIYPLQVSIEDSFPHVVLISEVRELMVELVTLLVRRMRIDLVDEHGHWARHAQTLRLTTRPRLASIGGRDSRISKSTAMPVFAFSFQNPVEEIAERLVKVSLMPLFRRLHPRDFDISLLNVAAVRLGVPQSQPALDLARQEEEFSDSDGFLSDASLEEITSETFWCEECKAGLPQFAYTAHQVFHNR